MPSIEVTNLRKTYGSTVAVDDIDLEVAEGEILGILGPNGSGKTTTVECIAGLRKPDSGSVRVLGHDPYRARKEVTKVLGVQLQEAGLQAKLTARDALKLYASLYENPVDGIALAERLNLGSKLDDRYDNLSGGQKQRLAIALALVGRPKIALLDELSTGLDPRSRREVWGVVEDAREEGTTVILVTHMMEEARHLCDRLAVIDKGRVAALNTVEGLIGQTSAPTVMTFGTAERIDDERLAAVEGVAQLRRRDDERLELSLTDDAVVEVLDILQQSQVRPHKLRIIDSTLDDAFLSLTESSPTEGEDA